MQSLGIEIAPLTESVAKQLGIEEQSGVVITSVQTDSSAAEAGLQTGMVIASVNRTDVRTAEEFTKIVDADKDGELLLLIRTERGSRFVVVNR